MEEIWRDWTDLALLAADTDRTQDYVFESARLPEIRGASSQLDHLNHTLETMVNEAGGDVIYAGGGSLLALTPASVARTLTPKMEALYPEHTTVATITVDWREIPPDKVDQGYPPDAQAPFGALVRWAGTWLRRRKESRSSIPFVEALPHTERCRSCLTRPANPTYLPTYPDWPLCDVCHAKRAHQGCDWWFRRFQEYLDENREQYDRYYRRQPSFPRFARNLDRARWTPQDLSEIGEACKAREGYVGFIYLDGDGMGRVFERLPTIAAYATLSRAVEAATREAVMAALATLHPAWVHPSDARPKNEKPSQSDLDPQGRMRIHPFDIITIGGDDIVLITPADVALPVAAQISRNFQQGLQRHLAGTDLPDSFKTRPYTMSGGVVLASDHNPVRVLRDLSKELQREAKKARRSVQAEEGYIDFLVLKSADMLESSVEKARELYPYTIDVPGTKPLRLMGRPYRVSVWEKLWQELCDLRAGRFSASQIHLLGEALLRGRSAASLFYRYQQARERDRQMQQLTQALAVAHENEADVQEDIPWLKLPDESAQQYSYQTGLWDIAELYDFVPAGKEKVYAGD
jgi:hypothetical protein